MNKLDLIHYIINKLMEENKIDNYMLWFDTIRDPNITSHDFDHEYNMFTTFTILEYLQKYVRKDSFRYLYNLQFEDYELCKFLTFGFNRRDEFVNDEFYDLFTTEANGYLLMHTIK